VERYRRVVYSIPRRRGLPPCDCDDVFQATWLTAVRRGDPPGDEAHLVRWLAAIAAWETRGLLRRRRPIPQAPEAFEERSDGRAALPERELAQAERHGALEGALRAIGDRDRRLLEALFLADEPLSYEAVAAHFGVRPGSVGPLRLRALDRLRSELTRRGF
jgi:RNA polymerase sigma factor (sigma-70 family)